MNRRDTVITAEVGSTAGVLAATATALFAQTDSSRNMQITQTGGATQTMQWSWRRLS